MEKDDGKIHPEDYNVYEPNELNDLTGKQIDQILRELVKRAKRAGNAELAWPEQEGPRCDRGRIWAHILKEFDDTANISKAKKLISRNFFKDKTFKNFDVPHDLASTWGAPEKSVREFLEEKGVGGDDLNPSRTPFGIPIEPKNQKYLSDQSEVNEVKWDKYGLPFLKCICGSIPYILQKEGVMKERAWMVYCPKCRIHTEFYDFLDTARNTWNAHALHGEIHKDKREKMYVGNNTTHPSDRSLIRISKMEAHKNYLEYFYTFDFKYMNKIKTLLKPGMVFRNYVDLCDYIMDQREPPGTPQITHKKWWKRFFAFEKSGDKIIVTEIYNNYIPWGKDPERPNKGRTMKSYRPKNIIDGGRRGEISIDNEVRNNRHKILKKVDNEIERARNALYGRKNNRPGNEEDNEPEEYEIYEEDDWMDEEMIEELYDLDALVDSGKEDVDENKDGSEENANDDVMADDGDDKIETDEAETIIETAVEMMEEDAVEKPNGKTDKKDNKKEKGDKENGKHRKERGKKKCASNREWSKQEWGKW